MTRFAHSPQLAVPPPPVAGRGPLQPGPPEAGIFSSSSSSGRRLARLVCSCGTHVLFPGTVEHRTCWKCGARLALSPKPTEVFPAEVSLQDDCSCSAAVFPATAPAQRQQNLPVGCSTEQHQQATTAEQLVRQGHVHLQPAWSGSPWIWGILATSLSLNLAMILHSNKVGFNERMEAGLDSDGDGILDQHDFCPTACVDNKGHDGIPCSHKGWVSGRATDFDADGCEDNAQDTDKDNDGVKDSVDKCPFTPQKYQFMSNLHSDIDGDGCMDSVEDHDDDGDMVLNALDRCPKTPMQHESDTAGCSQLQLRDEAAAIASRKHAMPVTNAAEHTAGEAGPGLDNRGFREMSEEWFGVFRSAWVEMLVGAVVTELCGQVGSMKRVTTEALGKVGRGATLKKLALRLMIYIFFFAAIYTFRFYFQQM